MDFRVLYCHVDPHLVTKRLVRNPNYGGGPCDVPGCVTIPLVERAMKPRFFSALEADVASNGFRNPALVYGTSQGVLLQFGGSRVKIAKRLDTAIPVILVDYTGEWEGEEVTPDNWQTFFMDVPVLFEFTEYGVDTHYSLERNRRQTFDPKGLAWVPADNDFIDHEFPWIGEYDEEA